MALYIKQSEARSQLQEKIAADLKKRTNDAPTNTDRPDGVEDSAYVKNLRTTTKRAWIWLLVAIICVVILFVLSIF